MNSGLSIYLDAVRFGAAVSVFLYHLGYGKLSGDPFFANFEQLGTPAVLLFFVLSGFVISYVNATREQTLRDYAIARMSRLFSVTVPALLLTAVCDTLGNNARPDLYPVPITAIAFVRDLTFTNQIWTGLSSFGSMVTYWSLGFEACYYILFAIGAFARGWRATALVLLVGAVFGPEVRWMFPVWLLGCVSFSITRRIKTDMPLVGWPLFVLPIIMTAGMIHYKILQPIAHGLGYDWPKILLSYLVGGLFCTHIVGARLISAYLLAAFRLIHGLTRWFAGATFTLYLLHLPFAFVIRAYLPRDMAPWQTGVILVPAVVVLVLVAAEFSERRKAIWKVLFERLLPRRQQEIGE